MQAYAGVTSEEFLNSEGASHARGSESVECCARALDAHQFFQRIASGGRYGLLASPCAKEPARPVSRSSGGLHRDVPQVGRNHQGEIAKSHLVLILAPRNLHHNTDQPLQERAFKLCQFVAEIGIAFRVDTVGDSVKRRPPEQAAR